MEYLKGEETNGNKRIIHIPFLKRKKPSAFERLPNATWSERKKWDSVLEEAVH